MSTENLKAWLDGKYVPPQVFIDSLKDVLDQVEKFNVYCKENCVESIEEKLQPYYEEMAKLYNNRKLNKRGNEIDRTNY